MRILCAAAALCLLPITASAQDGLPSAVLQMGLPSASLDRRPLDASLRRDLFRAAPATFAPGFDEPPRIDPRFLLCCGGFPGTVFLSPVPWWAAQPQVVYVPVIVRDAPRAAPPPAVPPAPAPPPAPGVPKTFYVIPGCYAGDRPPDPDALPRNCDVAKVRVIPPRVP